MINGLFRWLIANFCASVKLYVFTDMGRRLSTPLFNLKRGTNLRFYFLPKSFEKKPPFASRAAANSAFVHLQRWFFGIPASAISIWFPQPDQVGFLQLKQVVREHMISSFVL
jgi:hypothetical protein